MVCQGRPMIRLAKSALIVCVNILACDKYRWELRDDILLKLCGHIRFVARFIAEYPLVQYVCDSAFKHQRKNYVFVVMGFCA